jgi:2-methylcitrate dehydratase PrpD
MQRIIEAARNLRQRHHIDADAIDVVEVEMSPRGPDPSRPEWTRELSRPAPASGLDGKFSLEYCVAVALTQNDVDTRSFTNEVLSSHSVQTVLPKVRVKPNADIPASQDESWVIVRVCKADGGVLESRCQAFKGHRRNPMSHEERLEKFRRCTRYSLAPGEVQTAIDAVEHIEDEGSIGALGQVLRSARIHEHRRKAEREPDL